MKMKHAAALFVLLFALLFTAHASCEELYVFADAWNSEMNPMFAEAYPDVAVRNSLEAATHVSFDQMLVDLLAGENSYDMFYLSMATGHAKTLSDRGYLADLGQSELIAQTVSQMPASFQQQITTDDGGIFAFPCTLVTTDYLMGFNTEVAEKLGIEKPETYAEFLDLLARWDDEYEAKAAEEGLYLVDESYAWTASNFLRWMVNAYIAGVSDVSTISYETEEFRMLMALYDQNRELLTGLCDNIRVMGDGQPWKSSLIIANCPLLTDADTEESYGGVVEPMMLFITDDAADAVIPVDMEAYSICDGTSNLTLALNYLECRASSFTAAERILFAGGNDGTPVERENYAATLAYYNAIIPATEAQIEANSENAELIEELQAELAQYKLELEDCLARRYEYTSESIRQYASLAEHLCPMPSISYDYYISQPNTKYLLDSFEQGTVSIDQFVKEFDYIQMMMNLESQY